MFTFTFMIPKHDLPKHDFKTGGPKPKLDQQTENMLDTITRLHELINNHHPYGGFNVPIVTQKGKLKQWWGGLSLVVRRLLGLITAYLVLPSLIQLFFMTVNLYHESNKFYPIYMGVLSNVRLFGIGLTSVLLIIILIKTKWKSK
jgi:hypothetical protein